ncbi:MAG: GIY-YIG nuclease family protein [Desulfobacteraceae bacterium]|nr:GIY-YIG nuclease family protein [Desulfobacteraceae bacterium]MBC2754985.1 GIY-YIG nuclease family protein [Desulfobacteraceae bacterium]
MKNHLKKQFWTVYILRNEKNALYTGITTNLKRRLIEHKNKLLKGAKFTRSCKALDLVYQCEIGERGQALKVEAKIKRLKKDKKERIVAAGLKKAELYKFLSLMAS